MRPLDRAIAAGLILAEPYRPGRVTRLFANERDRYVWYSVQELLASPSPQRAAQIAREIYAIGAGRWRTTLRPSKEQDSDEPVGLGLSRSSRSASRSRCGTRHAVWVWLPY